MFVFSLIGWLELFSWTNCTQIFAYIAVLLPPHWQFEMWGFEEKGGKAVIAATPVIHVTKKDLYQKK